MKNESYLRGLRLELLQAGFKKNGKEDVFICIDALVENEEQAIGFKKALDHILEE